MDLKSPTHNSRHPKPSHLILIGSAFTVIGIVCGYFFLYRPLLEMSQHSANVTYSIKGQFLSPVTLITGLFILIAPTEVADKMLQSGSKKSKWFWIWLLMIMGGAALTYFIFSHMANGYGYPVH